MADTPNNSQTLAEQYYVNDKQVKTDVVEKPVVVEEVEKPKEVTPVDAVVEKTVEETIPAAPVVAQESSEVAPPAAAEENTLEPSSETVVEDNSVDQEEAEEKPEIKLETAPVDFRFPTTNQTRHCFTRYIEYHRCVDAKGDDAPECDKFAKYYRALCPGEWVDRWNEQRENGTFPGPL
jgi:cytochrome c oxidase subunit 6b